MREPAGYGNDQVPIPVSYVLEIYHDTFRQERPVTMHFSQIFRA